MSFCDELIIPCYGVAEADLVVLVRQVCLLPLPHHWRQEIPSQSDALPLLARCVEFSLTIFRSPFHAGPRMADVHLMDQSLQDRPRLLLHHRRPSIPFRPKRQHGVFRRTSPSMCQHPSIADPAWPKYLLNPTSSSRKPSNTTISSSHLPPTSP